MRLLLLCLSFIFAPQAIFAQIFTNTPPSSPVRTMAEWEETGTLLVAWNSYKPAMTEIIKAAHPETKIVVFCGSQSNMLNAKQTLENADIVLDSNIQFSLLPVTTVWIRDYGPTSVYTNDVDSMLLIDWLYNRPNREKDDTLIYRYAPQINLPVYATKKAPYDLVNTGGNFMSDGMGTAFASNLILRNNNQIADGENGGDDTFGTSDHTEASIDSIMARYMGIDRYIKMEELPFDGIHHIDMHIKLLDEETLLVGSYPEGKSDGPEIKANIEYILSNYKTPFGNDYKIIYMPMPSFMDTFPPYPNKALYPTYTNALFVNKTIIYPIYNHALDGAAKDTLEKYLPGYNVVGVDCNAPIAAGGAVHCITKEIGVTDPLRIVHSAIRIADVDEPASWKARAIIQHKTGIAQAELFYTTDLNGVWSAVSMSQDSGDQWSADIPVQFADVTVYYYIKATANNGKTIHRPMTAPEGYWAFKVIQTSHTNWAQVAHIQPVYPNPARAITVIPVQMNAATRGTLMLVNAYGQVLTTIHEGEFPAGQTNYYLKAQQYPAGTYQVVLQTARQQIVQQLIIVD